MPLVLVVDDGVNDPTIVEIHGAVIVDSDAINPDDPWYSATESAIATLYNNVEGYLTIALSRDVDTFVAVELQH